MIFSIIILFAACNKVDELVVIPDDTTIEEDEAILKERLTEIKEIAESENCENADDWKLTAVGGNCCGPEIYIAYSNKINEKVFLENVEAYTNARNDFNVKWNSFVNCNLIDCVGGPQPKSVSCEDGKAIFNYDESNMMEQDIATLEKLLEEIKEIAENEVCENADEWKFTAIGSKACGGPTGFIAYSKKVDVADFLEKVENYTSAQNEFNIKWGIFSTCDVEPEPKGVSCVDGKAVLNY